MISCVRVSRYTSENTRNKNRCYNDYINIIIKYNYYNQSDSIDNGNNDYDRKL